MPANQKVFTEVKREKYDVFRQAVRTKALIPPYGDDGFLRGAGLLADLDFDERAQTLSLRIRELPKGETYNSVFGKLEDVLQTISV
jgi:hypothetical protein